MTYPILRPGRRQDRNNDGRRPDHGAPRSPSRASSPVCDELTTRILVRPKRREPGRGGRSAFGAGRNRYGGGRGFLLDAVAAVEAAQRAGRPPVGTAEQA